LFLRFLPLKFDKIPQSLPPNNVDFKFFGINHNTNLIMTMWQSFSSLKMIGSLVILMSMLIGNNSFSVHKNEVPPGKRGLEPESYQIRNSIINFLKVDASRILKRYDRLCL